MDLGDLNTAGRKLAGMALDAWTTATGIRFRGVSSDADITFDDEKSGSTAQMRYMPNGRLVDVEINVSKTLTARGAEIVDSAYTTYVHEIGHALGLGHPGPYDETASPSERLFDNDTGLMSVLSYFNSSDANDPDLGFARPATPMPAYVIAIGTLYGKASANRGDTVYGRDGNADGPLRQILASFA